MKTRTRTILVACFAIVTFNNFGTASVKVSSKVDLDSDQNEETLSNETFDTIANLNNESTEPLELILRTFKPSTINWRRRSELVKSSEPRKRRIYFSQDDLAKRPKVINNIQIVINSNDSLSDGNSCKSSGICDVSVSSKPDGKGNIVTDVHLTIITNTKPDAKINNVPVIEDIPVIDSFRGISEDQEKQLNFHPISTPNPSHSHHNIPQIQTNYEGYGEPYHHRRTFQRPRTYWNYRHFGDDGNVGFRGHKTWSRERPIVDDKIEPPLSKTKFSDDTES
ncbi:uncharacterized protein LOC114933464 [Nylanderia fulva]|uniref:uncharacterized protein LOC114933464 n=1 Tax=Nylanderia fulva TaxID=613905 RepID=UPI0010FB66C7|nr:uncharacterized protein LOC114933464 [Nylanderia fulva]